MTFEPHEVSNLVLGLRILICLLLPLAMVLLIKYVTTPVAPPQKPPRTLLPNFFDIHKIKSPALRRCQNHLTNLPKGRIALVVGQSQCGLCKNRSY